MTIPADHEKITTSPQKDHKEITATGDQKKIQQGSMVLKRLYKTDKW
jgi:hypothetical protein